MANALAERGATAPGTPTVQKAAHGFPWKALLPVIVAGVIAIIPPPEGLAQHAWYFFAIFAGVIVGLMVEPLPGAAIGLIGVVLVTLLSPYVLFGPAELAKAGFKPANASLTWALSGFSNTVVWLIFAAFMFALGYEKSGLGKRIALVLVKAMGRRTLTLGYAVTIADTLLAHAVMLDDNRPADDISVVVLKVLPLSGDNVRRMTVRLPIEGHRHT